MEAVTSWLMASWNRALEDLKPSVLTFAMLFDVTSSISWCERRPLMPEKRERSMSDVAFRIARVRVEDLLRVGGGSDFLDLRQRNIRVPDLEHRVAADSGCGDDAGVRVALLVG